MPSGWIQKGRRRVERSLFVPVLLGFSEGYADMTLTEHLLFPFFTRFKRQISHYEMGKDNTKWQNKILRWIALIFGSGRSKFGLGETAVWYNDQSIGKQSPTWYIKQGSKGGRYLKVEFGSSVKEGKCCEILFCTGHVLRQISDYEIGNRQCQVTR